MLKILKCPQKKRIFFMSLQTVHVQNKRLGTCPHGLPIGACPICNGLMGGGGAKKPDLWAKPGEMSYAECAAIGAFLKAQKEARMANKNAQELRAINIAQFQKTMDNILHKAFIVNQTIANSMPKIISAPINFIINTVIIAPLNILKNLPQITANFVQNITQKLSDLASKLTAVLGEIKNAIAKKISESFNEFKKKVKSIFTIFGSERNKNEDKKVDEAKKANKLKTFLHKLYRKLKNDDD